MSDTRNAEQIEASIIDSPVTVQRIRSLDLILRTNVASALEKRDFHAADDVTRTLLIRLLNDAEDTALLLSTCIAYTAVRLSEIESRQT